MSKAAFDTKQWDTFWKVWNRRLETLPGAKKAALFQAGQAVDILLNRQISTRVNDPRGRVKRWQELRLGSGGGYAAISPWTIPFGSAEAPPTNTRRRILRGTWNAGTKPARPPVGGSGTAPESMSGPTPTGNTALSA